MNSRFEIGDYGTSEDVNARYKIGEVPRFLQLLSARYGIAGSVEFGFAWQRDSKRRPVAGLTGDADLAAVLFDQRDRHRPRLAAHQKDYRRARRPDQRRQRTWHGDDVHRYTPARTRVLNCARKEHVMSLATKTTIQPNYQPAPPISINPERLSGQAVIGLSRVPVAALLDHLDVAAFCGIFPPCHRRKWKAPCGFRSEGMSPRFGT